MEQTHTKTTHLHHPRYHYHYGLLHRSELFIVEIVMFVFVIISLLSLAYSYFLTPDAAQLILIQYIDSFVALVLLIEFCVRFLLSKHRLHFLRHNWIYLCAAIPLPLSIATLLRSLRLAGFIKMLKVGLHVKHEAELINQIDTKIT